MYTAKDYRILSKAALGDRVFSPIWPMAAVSVLIFQLVSSLAGSIPVIGAIAVIVIAGAMNTGLMSIFLQLSRRHEQVNLGDMFNHFDGPSMGLGALEFLYIFLWTMLLFIPGIIKSYSYSMAYFIHLDRPELTAGQCITESRALMNGHKWRLFCLDISFIGWAIVGSLCLGIGTLWVNAWMYTARAEFYNSLISNDAVL